MSSFPIWSVVVCQKGEYRHLQGSLDSTITKYPHHPLAPPFVQPMGPYVKGHGVLKGNLRSIRIHDHILVRVMRYIYGSLYEERDTVVC
jgi:hypothetical protein